MASHVTDFCARLSNAYRFNRARIAIPENYAMKTMAFLCYRQGFLANVQRGTSRGPDTEYVPTTVANVGERRLWLDLRYHQERPALTTATPISKPAIRVVFPREGLFRLACGKKVGRVSEPQPGEAIFVACWAKAYPGKDNLEYANRSMCDVGKGYEIMELHEAVQRGFGGELLCRIR